MNDRNNLNFPELKRMRSLQFDKAMFWNFARSGVFFQSIYWGKSELQLIKSKFKSYLCKTLMFSPAVYVFKHHLNLFPVLNNQYFSFWIRMLLQSTPEASIVLWEISSHSSLELPTLFFSQRGNTFLLTWPGNSSSEKQPVILSYAPIAVCNCSMFIHLAVRKSFVT